MINHKDILEECSNLNTDEDGNQIYYEWEVLDSMTDAAKQAFFEGFKYGKYGETDQRDYKRYLKDISND